MEDKNIQESIATELPEQGSGSILAAERKKQKKTVEEIADLLNLSVHQVRTIELDQTDGLPEATYVRGYIRSYSNVLGLDADVVLNNFLHPNWQKARSLDDMSWSSADTDTSSKLGGGFSFVRFGVISTLLIAAAAAWYFGYFDQFLNNQQAVNSQAIVDVPKEDENTQNPAQLDDVESESISGLAGEVDELIEKNIDLTIALEDIPEENPALLDQEKVQLTMSFSQTSWIDIRDETDARLAYKSYVAGEELDISSTGPMSVFVGTAEAVSVFLNGEEFDIEPYREGVYAKFIVNNN